MKKRTIILFFFLCFIPSLTPAEEDPVSINLWPFLQYTSDRTKGTMEIDLLGPLVTWKKGVRDHQWGMRPLVYWSEEESESLHRLEYLYPLGKYEDRGGERKSYFSPLHLYKEERFDGVNRWDLQLFPFFVGETRKGEDYWGIFPLFGTFLDRYGRKEIRFYLWPLYSQSVSEGYTTTNVLWPFIGFTEGEKRRGLRIWPLYGYKEEPGVSKVEFFLWPIFFHGIKGMDVEDPVEERIIFPLYVSKESKRIDQKTYLWPFLSHLRDRLTGFEQWDFPYPIFRYSHGGGVEGFRIFPFYGYEEQEGGMKKTFILYPLYVRREIPNGDVQEKTIRILLLSQVRSGEGRPGEEKERSLRIWPFFDYERSAAGDQSFSTLYLIPYRVKATERNLIPLFRIFQWKKDASGRGSTNFLWGLYKRNQGDELESWEIAHLIKWDRGKDRKTISFLHGLFKYTRNDRSADLRLLFLPLHLGRVQEKQVN